MKRLLIFTTVLVAMVLATTLAMSSNSDEVEPNIFRDPAFTDPERPAVLFDHKMHAAMYPDDCRTCHHLYENGRLVEDKDSRDRKCAECHTGEGPERSPLDLEEAYHANCIECHDRLDQGPVLCGDCHVGASAL